MTRYEAEITVYGTMKVYVDAENIDEAEDLIRKGEINIDLNELNNVEIDIDCLGKDYEFDPKEE
jgi:hypothetical protein